MSKNLTIDEGGESRHFDGVRRLKTKLMGEDAGTCYWVPDDETQAWPTFIMNNGMHSAEDEGVYGFSEANVNVYIPTPNPDWDIWIDDDDIPHIKIDDIPIDDWDIDSIELTIDPDTGTPIVDIEDITSEDDDLVIPQIIIRMDDDGLPTSDIDFKTDIHVWTDPDDHTKIHVKEEPNGEEIVLDYDDIDGTVTFKDLLDIRYDDTVIGEEQWVIEAHTKIKVDDVDYEAGDVIKSWDKDEIVDFTMKVEQEISVDFPDIDPDFGEDFDIELDLDNMELEMDGLDMDIDLPLLKMPDLDDELPDEIRIMHVPDKTSYQDGEAIDLDGIVVQAYRGGEVWQNKKYVNGYIPAHELSIDHTTASIGDKHYSDDIPTYTGDAFTFSYSGKEYNDKGQLVDFTRVVSYQFPQDVYWTPFWFGGDWIGVIFATFTEGENVALSRNDGFSTNFPINNTFSRYYSDVPGFWNWSVHVANKAAIVSYEMWDYSGAIGADVKNTVDVAYKLLYGEKTASNKVSISWTRPIDGVILSDSYSINIS